MQMLGFANDRSREFNQNLNQSLGVERAKIRGEQPTLADLRADKYITDEMANAVMGGMTAWHGSPHTFNKFDMSKIGTGEGAQAYGHGLYLAENPKVAQGYQKDISKNAGVEGTIGDIPLSKLHEQISRKADRLPIDKAQAEYEKLAFLEDLDQQPTFKHALERIDSSEVEKWAKTLQDKYKPAGNLYKVDLPDEHIEKMLDWDKPLSEQPHVINSLRNQARIQSEQDARSKLESELIPTLPKKEITGNYLEDLFGQQNKGNKDLLDQMVNEKLKTLNLTKETENYLNQYLPKDTNWNVLGKDFYNNLATTNSGAENASKNLKNIGIPGIKYYDEGSRNNYFLQGQQGTRNFVIFDPNLAKIEERNSVPIPQDPHQPNYLDDLHTMLGLKSKDFDISDVYSPTYLGDLHSFLSTQKQP